MRVVTIAVLSVVAAVLGIWLVRDATTALGNTLLIMLYLLAPWTAVNLVDYFFVCRGHCAITDLFTPDGIYGAWAWRGILAFAVGIVFEIPFMVLTSYRGVAAQWLSEVDISFLVGLVLAGGLYYLLTRSLDLSAEQPAIERSEAVLPR
jgi:purine-cytosine permease-like protein